jgi:predicted unusual protein kinase regulating ubiquinone biosynthesis (AarF/ABC1/UbiB family)
MHDGYRQGGEYGRMSSNEFPSTRFERGKIFARTGLKVGTNYAAHYLKTLGRSSADKSELHKKTATEVFGEFTKLRGTALKIAQSFSIDQGFLPDEFSEIMTQAQYSVPPINRSLVRSIIRRELGSYPEQLFAEFNPEAIAAASIGQVHKAKLKDGRTVAVKVQYPGVRDTISSDLALARTLFRRIVSDATLLDEYMNEVRSTLLDETDYEKEGESIDRFHRRFASDEVVTPEWIPEYSTGRILTMSFIEGVHLDEFLKSSPSQDQKNHYGQLLWNFFHRQIQDHEEIHADTHPGNFLFTPDGKLGVIDFGCVKTFPEEFFIDYLRLLPTHLARDEEEIKKLYRRLDVLKTDPEQDEKEARYYNFCVNYGYAFAMPYQDDTFDFGDAEYRDMIRTFTKNAPVSNEPRGSKHFIYSTRVHLGLYHFLMKLGAVVSTSGSREIVEKVISENA